MSSHKKNTTISFFPVPGLSFSVSPAHLHYPFQILRLMQGYDENDILLLPPTVPGEGLPTELLDYYKEYCLWKLKDDGSFSTHRRLYPPRTTEITHVLIVSVCTCLNRFYLCTPELKDDLAKEETKKDDMQEENKSSNESDAHPADSKKEEEEVHAMTVKTAELCKYNHFRNSVLF